MDAYRKRVQRSNHWISCEKCSTVRLPRIHAKHVIEDHDLPSNTHCPWCYAPFHETGKAKNEPHLVRCFARLEEMFKNFDKRVDAATFQMSCRLCAVERLTPREYLRHVASIHGKLKGCSWCGDSSELSLEHRVECFTRLEKEITEQTTEHEEAICEECIAFDSMRERNRMRGEIESPFLYEDIEASKLRGWCNFSTRDNVRFDEKSGLGADVAGYVDKFMSNKKLVWKHIFVVANAFESFREAMDNTRNVHLLPFWCLCDAGECEEDEYRVHFHGIVVCRSARAFTKMFQSIEFKVRKYVQQNSKYSRPIKTVHHLCNSINYVSGERSGCTGKGIRQVKKKSNCHYFIQRPVCPHANLYLHVLYEDGWQQYLQQRHGGRMVWDKKTARWEGRDKAFVLISDLPGEPRGCRPPLADDMEIGGDGPCCLWLPQGDRLWLKTLDGPRSEPVGLALVDDVLTRKFYLTKYQRRTVREIAKLQESAISPVEIMTDKRVLQSEIDRLRRDIEYLQREMTLKDDFNHRLSEKDAIIQERDKEIKQLLLDKLKVVSNLYEENKQLYGEIVKQMEDKIELKDQISFALEQLVKMLTTGIFGTKLWTFLETLDQA